MHKTKQTCDFCNKNQAVNHKRKTLQSTKQLQPDFTRQINNKSRQKPRKKGEYIGFMCSQGPALDYPIVEMLLAHAEKGCVVNFRKNLAKEHLNTATAWDPHISAKDGDVVACV